MADITYESARVPATRRRVDWGAIWGGVFTFLAIWTVFGVLGLAIFARAAGAATAKPLLGMGVGPAIWAIVLTVVAMFVAGLETGRLAGVTNRRDGMVHGLMMFGLSVVAFVVLASLGGSTVTSTEAGGTVQSPYVLAIFAELGWGGFIALFLGWLSAMWGASSGVERKAQISTKEVREMKPAA